MQILVTAVLLFCSGLAFAGTVPEGIAYRATGTGIEGTQTFVRSLSNPSRVMVYVGIAKGDTLHSPSEVECKHIGVADVAAGTDPYSYCQIFPLSDSREKFLSKSAPKAYQLSDGSLMTIDLGSYGESAWRFVSMGHDPETSHIEMMEIVDAKRSIGTIESVVASRAVAGSKSSR